MISLRDCQTIINQHLNEIKFPGLPANLYEPIQYVMQLEAKRIRPSLVLLACNLYDDDINQAIWPALAIEFFHNFTLVHDDIMDQSDLRRNHPTVHVKWSPNVAVLSGDAMVIKAYEMLSHVPADKLSVILPVFNQTALKVCEGQQFDMDYENNPDVTIPEYLKMVEYKTAVLLAAALKIGALSGGGPVHDAGLLYEFGRNIGIAFQLQDDLLDVFADSTVFGKVTGNDIVANKKTILLVEALHTASGKTREELLNWLDRKSFDRDQKVAAIQEIYKTLNIQELVRSRIREYHQMAVQNLEQIDIERSKRQELMNFLAYLMNRKN